MLLNWHYTLANGHMVVWFSPKRDNMLEHFLLGHLLASVL